MEKDKKLFIKSDSKAAQLLATLEAKKKAFFEAVANGKGKEYAKENGPKLDTSLSHK